MHWCSKVYVIGILQSPDDDDDDTSVVFFLSMYSVSQKK